MELETHLGISKKNILTVLTGEALTQVRNLKIRDQVYGKAPFQTRQTKLAFQPFLVEVVQVILRTGVGFFIRVSMQLYGHRVRNLIHMAYSA